MINKRVIGYLSLAVLLTLSASPVLGKKLSSPTYYLVAKKNLAKGTILGPNNTSVVSTTESTDIPKDANWLSTPVDANGFKIRNARGANEPITGWDLYAEGFNDPTPKATDSVWLKYAKSSVVCDRKGDFTLSRRYEEGALAQLEKLGKAHQKVVYIDDANWLIEMRHHSKESDERARLREVAWARAKAERPNNQMPDSKELARREQEMVTQMSTDVRTKDMQDRRYYAVFSTVLPPTCQLMQFLRKDLEDDAEQMRRQAADRSK